jgi:hypothetical protein
MWLACWMQVHQCLSHIWVHGVGQARGEEELRGLRECAFLNECPNPAHLGCWQFSVFFEACLLPCARAVRCDLVGLGRRFSPQCIQMPCLEALEAVLHVMCCLVMVPPPSPVR